MKMSLSVGEKFLRIPVDNEPLPYDDRPAGQAFMPRSFFSGAGLRAYWLAANKAIIWEPLIVNRT
jgi:hypothetical protein